MYTTPPPTTAVWFHLWDVPRIGTLTKAEGGALVTRAWGDRGCGDFVFDGDKASNLQDLETGGGEGCPKMCFLTIFISFGETERDKESRGGAEREREEDRLHAGSTEPDAGLEPTNREIMT